MDSRKEYQRAYYEAHKAEKLAASKKYQDERREELNAYRRQWRAEHPDKVAEYNRRYHAKKVLEARANQDIKRDGTERTNGNE